MSKSGVVAVGVLGAMLILAGSAAAQQSRWASADDPTAKQMTDAERQWAEAGCTGQSVEKTIADDFQGTAPNGKRYGKAEAITNNASEREHDCHLDDAKVRFFGENVAMVYGSERATRTQDGKQSIRCLVWTDTWLKRDGKWQIVAAQDTAVECK